MEKLTLEQALAKFGGGKKSNLDRKLKTKGYKFSIEKLGKGNYIYTIEEPKTESEWERLFGFEPRLPQATAKVLLFLDEGKGQDLLFDYEIAEQLEMTARAYSEVKKLLTEQGLLVSEQHQYQGGEYFYRVFGDKLTIEEFQALKATNPTGFVMGVKRVAFKSLNWGFLTEEQKQFLATV